MEQINKWIYRMHDEFNKIKLAFFLGKVSRDIENLADDINKFSSNIEDENQKKIINSFVFSLEQITRDLDAEEIICHCEN